MICILPWTQNIWRGCWGRQNERFCIQNLPPPPAPSPAFSFTPSEVSEEFGPSCHPTRTAESPPHPPNLTLTLALKLADDGVQVSVLGSNVAPADRHLSGTALAGSDPRPGSWRLLQSWGSAASGWGGRRPGGGLSGPARPPASALPALSRPPSPTAQRSSSFTKLAPARELSAARC